MKAGGCSEIADREEPRRGTVGAPPNVTIDAPASTLTWAVGDVVNVAAHATDDVDGNLPSSAFTWSVLIEHCPSSCHEHQLTTFTGATGSFPAPDHDYPTWLHLTALDCDASLLKVHAKSSGL